MLEGVFSASVPEGVTGAQHKFSRGFLLFEVLQFLKSYDLTQRFQNAYFLHLCSSFALSEEYRCVDNMKLNTGSLAFSFLKR